MRVMAATPMQRTAESVATVPDPLAPRLRMYLQEIAGRAIPITYQALAKALQLLPPQTIQKVTNALERLMAEDAAAGHPFIAALVVARSRAACPRQGSSIVQRDLVVLMYTQLARKLSPFMHRSSTLPSLSGVPMSARSNHM